MNEMVYLVMGQGFQDPVMGVFEDPVDAQRAIDLIVKEKGGFYWVAPHSILPKIISNVNTAREAVEVGAFNIKKELAKMKLIEHYHSTEEECVCFTAKFMATRNPLFQERYSASIKLRRDYQELVALKLLKEHSYDISKEVNSDDESKCCNI